MNAATRPPLYAYEEAYKSRRATAGSDKSPIRRIRNFSDTEYNTLANNIQYTRIVPTEKWKLQIHCTNPDSVKAALLSVYGKVWNKIIDHPGMGYFTLVFKANKDGKQLAQDYQLKIAECVGDPITGYTADRQYGITKNGSEIALTASYNARNVQVNPEEVTTGESGRSYTVPSNSDSQGADSIEKETKTYLIVGAAIVALIIIIWAIKKYKK